MIDDSNPTRQFHPYQAPTDTPMAERPPHGLNAILDRVGLRADDFRSMREQMKNLDINRSIAKARKFAQSNPGIVLGAFAAIVIGAGLMRRRSL
jgi:hypothetical protein